MKKCTNYAALLLLVLSVLLFDGCKGPAGPTGPPGSNGTQGPAGTPGTNGPTGTANVIYSNWTKAGPWTSVNVFGVQRSYIDITVPRLSQEILDRGLVLVYVKLETDNNQVRQLPVRIYAQFTEEMIDFALSFNKIRIWSTPIRPPVPPSPNNEFRYVLIPGGQAGRLNYEKMTYEEAKAGFGMAE